jgi:UDP-N-acetylmuramoyl-tripeptide--D-alanyl-D-alanine ligase
MLKQILKKIIVFIITQEAILVLKKYKPKIVAVTGSVGKTSTKDAIYSVLTRFYFTRKSAKSFNSDIGVPLTILGVPNGWSNFSLWLKNILEGLALILLPSKYPEYLVIEAGVDKPGDMSYLTSFLKPDIVVVTKLSKVPVHVEAFSSPQEVYKEKGKLVAALKEIGTVILNADDSDVVEFKNLTKAKAFFYGTSPDSDLVASDYDILYSHQENSENNEEENLPIGVTFNVKFKDDAENIKKLEVNITGTLGEHNMSIAAAALSVARVLNLNLDKSVEAVRKAETAPGRMRILNGVNGSTLLDDTYNSSPIALASALKTVSEIKAKRKIAVLGDMMELGSFSKDQHQKAGAFAASCVKILVTVGMRSNAMKEGAIQAGMKEGSIFSFPDSSSAAEFVSGKVKKGDLVLVKGSQSIRMEKVSKALLQDKEAASDFLVRQDEYWQNR